MPKTPPQVVGLTGGIATGKSTVARMLAEAGAVVIDADQIAREVVRKPLPAWREIRDHFGDGILGPDGELDRGRLGEIVFRDPEERRALEAIVHPRVHEETMRRIDAAPPGSLVVLDIPLLFETGRYGYLETVIVVHVPEALQLSRLMLRDGLSRDAAMARIAAQMPIEEKKARATRVIDNSGDLDQTRRQVESLMAALQSR